MWLVLFIISDMKADNVNLKPTYMDKLFTCSLIVKISFIWIIVAYCTGVLTDCSSKCSSFLILWACLLTVHLILCWHVCTVVIVISHLSPSVNLWTTNSKFCQIHKNVMLPYSPHPFGMKYSCGIKSKISTLSK